MPPKKPEKPPTNYLPEIIVFFVVLAFLSLVIARIDQIFAYYGIPGFTILWQEFLAWYFSHVWPIVKIAAVGVSVLSVAGTTYAVLSLREIEKQEKKVYGEAKVPAHDGVAETPKNDRWERVITHLNSPNESDWRFAVIESDIMLDDILTKAGYHGDTIGDKLKGIDKSEFTTIDEAWAAHKVRNRIAHDGASYPLSEREAKQTVALYEAVFKEFGVI